MNFMFNLILNQRPDYCEGRLIPLCTSSYSTILGESGRKHGRRFTYNVSFFQPPHLRRDNGNREEMLLVDIRALLVL
jgi:hypothetical protein